MTKALVIGSGGREHALIKALLRSPRRPEVLCAPGNAGIARDVRCIEVAANDLEGLRQVAVAEQVDLTVVGPEAPLVDGIVDLFEAQGLAVFGPSKAAARIEGSKAFAKRVMEDARVPTASWRAVDSLAGAREALADTSYPVALKADGLAAGKGVIIAPDRKAAENALAAFFVEKRFGEAADRVLVEEFLKGEELSLLALCDGENVLPMALAQDYKRIYDDDRGPNTGGMGSYSPVPGIGDDTVKEVVMAVHKPVIELLRERGTPYRGVLYAGLMLTDHGPKVLEFNCRFGDPETQAILPRLRSDLLEALDRSTRQGGLAGHRLSWSAQCAVNVVLASRGYPESSSKGDPIGGLERAEALPGVEIAHAGTAEERGSIVTAGGRVLGVTALGDNVAAARDRAYEAVRCVHFEGMQFRKDIAARAGFEQDVMESVSGD